ncbi:hypothetical protein GCM10009808_04520 [Microbacterium sediminicola]|uniref:PDZ domain-containing protein n=1 Tax=Microbacterium sediminicola TaxID=415210 RepID=A0ABP4TRR8_9MICO
MSNDNTVEPEGSSSADNSIPATTPENVAPAAAGDTLPTEPLVPASAAAPAAAPSYPAAGHAHPQQPGATQASQAPGAAQSPAFAYYTPPSTRTERAKVGAGKVTGIIVAAALVGGLAGVGGAYAGNVLFADETTSVAAGPVSVTVNDTESVNQTTAIAAIALPSVVTISATSTAGGGTGSGVILSEDGYVVTNTHVVTLDGATSDAVITVTTSDGAVYNAELVGTDPVYDLAVIKLVDAEGLTPIEFADSSDLNVGDVAVAIGAPLGLSNTVTTGIVSALYRSIEIASAAAPDSSSTDSDSDDSSSDSPFYFDFGQGQTSTATETIKISVIQTDAAINPGNSGGALVDSEGRLIGINVAIASASSSSDTSGSIGVGFSIPSNVVQRVAQEIIETGTATHGLLGASVRDAASVDGSSTTGAYVVEVTDGGAAQVGGLQSGDVVTAFNGVPVADATDLTALVRAAAAGSEATVTYLRDGSSHTIEVTLGELDG